MKKARHHEMLRSDIRQFVSRSSCTMLEDMIARVWERELDVEMEKKMKPSGVQEGSADKKPMVSDHRSRSQHGHIRCVKCGKMHEGTCKTGSSGCFTCSQIGHVSRDCTVRF